MRMKGCKKCPAYAKCTVIYQSAMCEALRATYEVDRPPEVITNADLIRAMTDETLSKQLVISVLGMEDCTLYLSAPTGRIFVSGAEAERVTLEWLQQPAKED